MFRSIARLPQLEGEVYRCRYEQGLTLDETLIALRHGFPELTMEQLTQTEVNVQESLSSQQFWLLSARNARVRVQLQQGSVSVAEEDDALEQELVDPRPNQEAALGDQEEEERVRSAVSKLGAQERLLIRLRFEEGLSLEQVAGLTGLGDAQRVHRRIAGILEKLRKEIRGDSGKRGAVSVQ